MIYKVYIPNSQSLDDALSVEASSNRLACSSFCYIMQCRDPEFAKNISGDKVCVVDDKEVNSYFVIDVVPIPDFIPRVWKQ